ncbi:MAG: IS1380 family transposase [Bacteroidales bacterium]|nr:IS1380 family transposase [Bacteroidales bacterium]
MKVRKNNQIINPFGGINFVVDAIKSEGILELIDNQLGKRARQAQYSYSDLILNLWSVFFCGGDRAEDVNEHLKKYLQDMPNHKVADADTILRVLKTLKTDKEKIESSKGNSYEINKNDKLNELNISILKKTNLLKEGEFYDFDYDNEVLKTEKYDTKKTYKMVNGYFPGMATIAGMPVYFENRDGNMHVKTGQHEVLERSYKALNNNGIYINRSRMDAGSYSKEIIEVVEKYSKNFYIRANRCESLKRTLLQHENWEKTEINNINYELCSIEYEPFTSKKDQEKKSYRLVVMRRKTDNKQVDIFTGDTMEYRSILTDDRKSTEKEVIEYYNARGTEEKTIDILNNDFGWAKMPFSFMEENTVFLMFMMMCKNVYTWLIRKFSEKLSFLDVKFRIKKFIFRFITVPSKWIKTGRQMILKIFSNKPYELLQV